MKYPCNNQKEYFVFPSHTLFFACNKHTSQTSQPAGEVTISIRHTLPSVLEESSGLCYTDGNVWSFGDSGNPNDIYKIDTTTGAILQTVTIQNFSNEDWKDITADDNYICIGDAGKNVT